MIIPGALTGLHPGDPGHYLIDYAALGTIEFDVRIKKTADLAAFTKAIERSLDTASSQIEFTKPKA